MGTHPDLEAVLAADEEGRAHVAAAERAVHARAEQVRIEREQQQRAGEIARERAIAAEVARIDGECDREIAARRARRATYLESKRAAREQAIERAAAQFAAIIRDGPAEGET